MRQKKNKSKILSKFTRSNQTRTLNINQYQNNNKNNNNKNNNNNTKNKEKNCSNFGQSPPRRTPIPVSTRTMNARSQGPHEPRQSQPNQPQTEAPTAIMDCTNCDYNTNWITALTTRKFVTATTISPITTTR